MTDFRFPERWLNDRRIMRLSDGAFRLFVVAGTWSVSNRTDGVIHDDDLALIPTVDTGLAEELRKADLWEHDADCWHIVGFEHTQTTAAQLEGLEHKRAVDRKRQAKHRAKTRQGVAEDATPSSPEGYPQSGGTHDVPRDVTRDETRDGTRDTKDRTGQARLSAKEALEEKEVAREKCDYCDNTDTRIFGAYRLCRGHAGPRWETAA